MSTQSEYPFQPRNRNPNPVHTRNPQNVEVKDLEQNPMKYIALGLAHLRNAMVLLPNMVEDFSKPVDEYRTQSLAPDSETSIIIAAQYETPEIIKSVVITGPTGAVSVQLGDRVWNLTIPASGVIIIAPILVCLDRDDYRMLTASSAGDYTLELMGHADSRGNLV